MNDLVIVIVGPTAVGKTEVGIELSNIIPCEIVSADSMAVYKEMDIGTAKPSKEEMLKVRFHLIDVADPFYHFSVGEFQRLAHNAIDGIIAKSKVPVVLGGSGLYVRAAIDGLDETVPDTNMNLRKQLFEKANMEGVEKTYSHLMDIDPKHAKTIHPNNLKRVVRALEIYYTTGKKPSELYTIKNSKKTKYKNALFFGLDMNREVLYNRIELRVDKMINSGLVEEVKRLLDRNIDINLPSMQGLGYKEIVLYLNGSCSLDEAVALLKKNTRQFAKRQYTWFRADERINWICVDGLTAREVSLKIKEYLPR
ncbi:MAG: tRNA (adenosine(37)-N6)-dimethylallyltransferase MiaA [Armatimonadota bacterium]